MRCQLPMQFAPNLYLVWYGKRTLFRTGWTAVELVLRNGFRIGWNCRLMSPIHAAIVQCHLPRLLFIYSFKFIKKYFDDIIRSGFIVSVSNRGNCVSTYSYYCLTHHGVEQKRIQIFERMVKLRGWRVNRLAAFFKPFVVGSSSQ